MSGICRRAALSRSKDKRILNPQKFIKCPEKPGGAECGESRKLGFEREYQKATSGSTPNEDWQEQLESMSEWRIRQAFKLLREEGIVLVERFMAQLGDQTNYYTIDYARTQEFIENFRKNRKSIKKPQTWFQTENAMRRARYATASLQRHKEQLKEDQSQNCTIDEEVNTASSQSKRKSAQTITPTQMRKSKVRVEDNCDHEMRDKSCSSYSTKTTDQRVQSKPIHNPHHHPHMDRDREGAGSDRNLDSKGSGEIAKENPKPKLRDVLKRPVKKNHATKAVRKEANVPPVEPLFNTDNLTSINELFDKVVQELVQSQSVPPVPETVEPDVVQDKVQLPQDKPEPKPKPQKTPKGTKPNKKIHQNSLYESHEQREAFKRDAFTAFNNGVGHARHPMGLVHYIDKEIQEGRNHPYFDEWKDGLPIGFGEKQEWEIAPGYPSPLFVQYLQEKLKNNTDSNEQALLKALNLLKDITQARMFWTRFKGKLEGLRDDAEKCKANGFQVNIPTWLMELPEISLERAAESARYLAESAPEQVHWLTRKLGELGDASKILNAYSNPLFPDNSPAQDSVTPDSQNVITNKSETENSGKAIANKEIVSESTSAIANESLPENSTELYANNSSSQDSPEVIAQANDSEKVIAQSDSQEACANNSEAENLGKAIADKRIAKESTDAVPQATAERVAHESKINDSRELYPNDSLSQDSSDPKAESQPIETIAESDGLDAYANNSEAENSGKAIADKKVVEESTDAIANESMLQDSRELYDNKPSNQDSNDAYTEPNSPEVILESTPDPWEGEEAVSTEEEGTSIAPLEEAASSEEEVTRASDRDKAANGLSEEQDPWSVAYAQAQVIFDNIRIQRKMNREADQQETDQQEIDQSEADQVNGNDPMNFEDRRNLEEYIREIEERRRNENQSSDPEPDF